MTNAKKVEWILRIAIAGEFLGHGVFALQGKEGWFKYFYTFGITDSEMIIQLLFLVGLMDIALALIVLVKPIRIILLWMAIWAFWTAMIRWPVGPDPIWDFFERWANWGAPLSLLFLYGWPKTIKDFLKVK
jgi:hypothetical protein